MAEHLPASALVPWLEEVMDLYSLEGLAPLEDVSVVLDVARDVARNVARPAAPLTTFLLGLAVGRAVPTGEIGPELSRLAAEVRAKALEHTAT